MGSGHRWRRGRRAALRICGRAPHGAVGSPLAARRRGLVGRRAAGGGSDRWRAGRRGGLAPERGRCLSEVRRSWRAGRLAVEPGARDPRGARDGAHVDRRPGRVETSQSADGLSPGVLVALSSRRPRDRRFVQGCSSSRLSDSRPAMMRSRWPSTPRWLSARRRCPSASAASMSWRVSSAWWRWMGRNSTVVWKSGQVRQALGCGQSCWGGRPQ